MGIHTILYTIPFSFCNSGFTADFLFNGLYGIFPYAIANHADLCYNNLQKAIVKGEIRT